MLSIRGIGPYRWADGLTPRADGLLWECTDFANDGTHPPNAGVSKVADLLMKTSTSSLYARPWFRAIKPADLDADGEVGGSDLAVLLGNWGG